MEACGLNKETRETATAPTADQRAHDVAQSTAVEQGKTVLKASGLFAEFRERLKDRVAKLEVLERKLDKAEHASEANRQNRGGEGGNCGGTFSHCRGDP